MYFCTLVDLLMVQFASVVGLLKTLLIIMLVYLGFKTLARLFAPLLLKFVAKKAEERFGGNFQSAQQQQTKRSREGETVIDKVPQQPKSSNKDVGEYIDFEEVD